MFQPYCKVLQIEEESYINRKDYQINKLQARQENNISLKPQQYGYFLHLSYYHILIKEGKDIIDRFLKKIDQQTQMQTKNLSKVLRIINQTKAQNIRSVSKLAINQVQKIIKKKMQETMLNMEDSKKKIYEQVLKQHKYISEKSLCQYKLFESEITIQKLFYLDIYSMVLQKVLCYQKFCNGSFKLLTFQTIKFIFNFTQNQHNKLLKIHKQINNHLKYDHGKEFQQLVFIHHLLKIRNRYQKHQKDMSSAFLIDTDQLRKIVNSQQSSDLRVYNFCQVAFLTHEKYFKDHSYQIKFEILKNLQKTIKSTEASVLKNDVIFIKVKYGIDFNELYKIRQLMKQRSIKQIKKLIYQHQLEDKSYFQSALRYIFLKDMRFEKAFSQFGLNKRFNLSRLQKGLPSPQLDSFANAFINFYEDYSQILCRILQIQEAHGNQFIVIKRISFTYEEIKVITKEEQMNSGKKIKDLTCNMILATNRRKILSFSIARQALNTERYEKILRQICVRIRPKKPFILLLYEYNLQTVHNWNDYYRFSFFVKKNLDSRVYITNMRKYSELNELILCHIFTKIKLRQAYITKNNFYDFTQKMAFETIKYLSSRNLKYSQTK